LIEHAFFHEFETDNLSTFLENVHRGGGHGSGQNAANVCVMPTRRGKEDDFFGFWMENGTDYGDIWEMPAVRSAVNNRQKGNTKELAILLHEVSWSSEHPLP
jgi:hypothetical protein